MQPFRIVFSVLLVNRWEVSGVPNLSIVEEIRPWGMGNVSLCTSQMKDRLNTQGTSFSYFNVQLRVYFFEVGLIGIDKVGCELVGSSSGE